VATTARGQVGSTSGEAAAVGVWPASRIFAAALVLQLFHLLEHVVQVAQGKFLGIKPAHGILGSFFDLEWVHFLYNWGLFIALIVATIAVMRERRIRPPVGWLVLGATLAVQSYHVVEHTVKIVQHVTTGIDPAPGILGQIFDLIWLHFDFNLIVTLLMIGAFVWLGLYAEVAPGARSGLSRLLRR